MKTLKKNIPDIKGEESIKVNKTLKPVDRKDSNVETERGEVIVGDFTNSGFPELYIAGGQPHSNGGSPMFLPNNSFVFSQDKSMRITDEDVQEDFNKTFKKKGYTPAEIAKQYDINKYRQVLADKDSDKLERETAEDMIKNYNEKLGKLALVQESLKSYPDGIPFISIPYLESMGINPANFVNNTSSQEVEVPLASEEDVIQRKLGGSIKVKIKSIPKYAPGGDFEGITPHKSKTKEGKTTPTLNNSDSPLSPEQYAEYYNKYGIDTSNLTDKQAQEALYDKADPFVKAFIWGRYGDTEKGGTKDKFTQFGLMPNEDFNTYKQRLTDKYGNPDNLNKELGKYKSAFADGKSGARTAGLLLQAPQPKLQQPSNVTTGQNLNIQNNPKDLIAPTLEAQQVEQDNPFWTQDIVNMAGAFGDLQRIKKHMPWQANYDTVLPEATFYDPTRELAASAEQSNIAAQTLGAFAGPQQLSARLSSVQGQGVANAANILGKYNELNVGIANQNNANQTNIINQANVNRANLATALYDKTVATNQQFDNARAMARQNLRQSFIQAWTNRGQTQSLNAMNKQYKVDPVTGYTEFTGVPNELNMQANTKQAIDLYNEIRSRPGVTDEVAVKIFESLYRKGK